MDDLVQKHCVPCEAGTLPLPPDAVAEYAGRVPEWRVVSDTSLSREFTFKDFTEAMAFVNSVAETEVREGWVADLNNRSEERSVGKESRIGCRSWWSEYH
jgi:4a-hydroxytetrahydrobiopterin dehydratase